MSQAAAISNHSILTKDGQKAPDKTYSSETGLSFETHLYAVTPNKMSIDRNGSNLSEGRPYFGPNDKIDPSQGCFPQDTRDGRLDTHNPTQIAPIVISGSGADYAPIENSPVMGPPVDTPQTVGMPLGDGGFTVYMDNEGNIVCGQPPVRVCDKPFETVSPYEDNPIIVMHGIEPAPPIITSKSINPMDVDLSATGTLIDNGCGFTVYIDQDGNIVCGTPPWIKEITQHPMPFTPNPDAQGIKDSLGYTLPPTPVEADVKPVINIGPVGHHLLVDGGFTVYLDENGNAVCGTPPHPVQTAIDEFVRGEEKLSPVVSNWPTPVSDTGSFAEIHGSFDLSKNTDAV